MARVSGEGPAIIAVCGKGGVGKTSLSAMMARILAERQDSRVLAVDADPASGLAMALGFAVEKTVDDVRNDFIRRLERGETGNAREVAADMDYEMLGALAERGNLAFMAIGRPEKEGCYCRVNDFLRDVVASLAAGFDYVVIDGEAGIEQINRRVMDRITHLVLVSDASAKGIRVARTVVEVAERTTGFRKAGLVVNRIRGDGDFSRISIPPGLEVVGLVPEEEAIRSLDIDGASLMGLPRCPALEAAESVLEKLGL